MLRSPRDERAKRFQIWIPFEISDYVDERCRKTGKSRQQLTMEALEYWRWALEERNNPEEPRGVGSFKKGTENTREYVLL
ncbi:MAG: hypothetical protein Q8Q90_00185 [bacterium]|nr:hypothetical protein [bacterium]